MYDDLCIWFLRRPKINELMLSSRGLNKTRSSRSRLSHERDSIGEYTVLVRSQPDPRSKYNTILNSLPFACRNCFIFTIPLSTTRFWVTTTGITELVEIGNPELPYKVIL